MPWRQVADQWLHWGGLAQHNLASAASVWSWCNVFASCNRLTVSCKPASKVKVANYISLLTLKSFPRSSVLFFPSALRVLLTSATQGWQVVEMAFWQENYPFIKVKIMPFASLALCTCLFINWNMYLEIFRTFTTLECARWSSGWTSLKCPLEK